MMRFDAGIISRLRTWRLRMVFLLAAVLNVAGTDAARGATADHVSDPALVAAFYKATHGRRYWFSENNNGALLRSQLLSLLEQCATQGLDPQQYPIALLQRHNADSADTATHLTDAECLFTDVALRYLNDLLTGNPGSRIMPYDEVSAKAKYRDNATIIDLLADCSDAAALLEKSKTLEPGTQDYRIFKTALREALAYGQLDTVRQLSIAMNTYRWIYHFHFAKCIVVNIPSASLYYYEQDSLKLDMKVVAGKPATPTPRLAAYCDQVILYPYWNVPRSIAVNELLPLAQNSPGSLNFMNMQVLDSKGNQVDPEKISWKAYNKKNFPFRFRQSTGCDNALGVIKLNLSSPYGVYLHDTNSKFAFKSDKRFMSHGCIRIEQPVALSRLLLDGDFDETLVGACVKQQEPMVRSLPAPVPVFVIYTTADIADQGVRYYPDVYQLGKKP